jgi:hypothetical protein
MQLPDGTPIPAPRGRSGLGRLAIPHSFGPDLGLVEAFFAVMATLFRIFSACLFFAGWGGLSIFAWSAIGNRFWQAVAAPLLILLFCAGLGGLMLLIAAIEKKIAPKRH